MLCFGSTRVNGDLWRAIRFAYFMTPPQRELDEDLLGGWRRCLSAVRGVNGVEVLCCFVKAVCTTDAHLRSYSHMILMRNTTACRRGAAKGRSFLYQNQLIHQHVFVFAARWMEEGDVVIVFHGVRD